MPASGKYLIVICGPTASGKTTAAIKLARHFNTEILSTDSRQIFREMTIGTAKPTEEELAQAKHHFINTVSVEDEYSAGQFERDALALLDVLFENNNVAIAAGGTGLYIKALTEGFDDIPAIDPAVRESVIKEYEDHGLEHLQEKVKAADPDSYAVTDIQNPQRLMRLLEVYRSTGRPRSAYLAVNTSAERHFTTLWIGLQVEREILYERINKRVDQMMGSGLLDEVRALHGSKHLNALQTVGYSELMDHVDGKTGLEEAVSLIKRNSRRYAKRQMTWFRKNDAIMWFGPEDTAGMIQYIEDQLSKERP